jgi:photosystem II stability/assembly factor-like uncharacterized protein
VTDQALLLTDNGGASWIAATPRTLSGSNIATVAFLDRMHGWVASLVGGNPAQPTVRVDRTTDGGRTWATAMVGLGGGAFLDGVGEIGFDFIDTRVGWLQVAVSTNTGNSLGTLFGTSNGGATWRPLQIPIGSPVGFVTPTDGWTAGGVVDRSFDVTRDGGASWAAATVPLPADRQDWVPTWTLPTFFDADHGILPVTLTSPVADSGVAEGTFYATSDRGARWTIAGRTGPSSQGPSSVAVSSAVLGPAIWLSETADGRLLRTDDGGRTWRDLQPQGFAGLTLIELDFVTAHIGWAVAVGSNGGCWELSGFTCGNSGGILMATTDGGSSWTPISVGSDAAAAARQAADAAAALATVDLWEQARQTGDVDGAWQVLSIYGQQVFGSYAAFASAEQTYLNQSGNGSPKIYPFGPISSLDRATISEAILSDVSAVAELDRAFVAQVDQGPGALPASEELVVAPLKDGGAWRIWIID